MDLQLTGKRVLVTGGSKGIGRSICETFVAEGAEVEFCARNAADVASAAAAIGAQGTSVDVTDRAGLRAWVEAAAGRLGGVDYIVANASALANGTSEENWQLEFDVDIMGTQVFFDAALPHLQKAAHEHGDAGMVAITSVSAAETSYPNAYGAAKAALIHLIKGFAKQQAANKVRANAVSPGTIYFKDGIWNQIEQGMPEVFKQSMARNPLGRMGTPQEIADATVFLNSPRSSFTTGSNLVVDGAITGRINF